MDAAFAHAEDDLLGAVHDFVDVLAFVIGQFGHLAGGGDEAAQHCGALDDAGVVVHVDRSRRGGDQVGDVGGAADFFEMAVALQFVDQGDEVDGLVAFVQAEDGLVDQRVARPVEVGAAQEVGHLDDGVRVDEQRADHGAFGFVVRGYIFGRSVIRLVCAVLIAVVVAVFVVDVHHGSLMASCDRMCTDLWKRRVKPGEKLL